MKHESLIDHSIILVSSVLYEFVRGENISISLATERLRLNKPVNFLFVLFDGRTPESHENV